MKRIPRLLLAGANGAILGALIALLPGLLVGWVLTSYGTHVSGIAANTLFDASIVLAGTIGAYTAIPLSTHKQL